MKKALIGIVGVIALIIIGALVAVWLIDWNSYVAKAVHKATGRELSVGGDVRLSLLPDIEFSASDVRLSNAPGMAPAEMVSVGAVRVKLKLWPLLRRRVLIDTFVISQPAVFLEVDKAGQPNWAFKDEDTGTPAEEPAEAPAERGGGLPINDLRLGDVRIEQGRVSYIDATTGQKLQAKDINLKVALPDLGSLLSLTGKLTLNDKPITVDVSVDSLQGAFSGKRFALKAAVSSNLVSARYDGSAQQEPVPGLDGKFSLDVPSVGRLAAWLDRPLNQPDPGPVKIRAAFAADGAKVELKEATVEARALKAKANGSFDGTGKITKVKFDVQSGVLDIDRYLPPIPAGKKKVARRAKKREDSGDLMASLSTEPFDLSGLRQAEADVRVAIGGVKASGFEVGRVTFTTNLKGGILAADLSALGLYGGSVKGKFKLDGSGDALSVESALAVDGVKVDKLVEAATRGKSAVSGIASSSLNATARGTSPRALAESLSGKLLFDLGGVDIKGASVGEISEVKVNLTLPGVDRTPSLKGSMVYNKERVNLDLTLDKVKKILSGERFALKAAVSSKRLNLLYDGSVQQKPVPGLDGKFNLDVPSVGKLAAWLDQPLDPTQPDPGPLKLRAAFAADGAKVALKEATIEGKALKVKAAGSFDRSNPVAAFKANIDVEEMDLNPYLPKQKPKKAATAEKKPAAEPQRGWSEDPIDLTALSKANGDVQIKINSIRYRGLVIQRGRLTAKLADGVLKTSIDELKLADGTVGATATIDASKETVALDYQVSIADVEARPLLKAFADTDRFSGRAHFQTKGKARGRNQKELVETLNGNGQFKFLNGAIHGINLAAVLRKAKTLGLETEASATQKTDFAELSGSFVITDGLLDNRDLKMVAPLVRLTGKGLTALPPRTTDYQVVAKLVASLEGHGGQDALTGLPIPIEAKGPWDKVAYKVDWKSVFNEVAKDPKRLENMSGNLRQMGKNFGVDLPIMKIPGTGKLRGAIEEPKQEETPSASDPLNKLKGLFGR